MAERKIHLDILRITAIFWVLFNHTPGYALFKTSTGAIQIFYMFLTMVSRLNVPVFFMISGALLLGKADSVSSVIKKRVSRIALTLLIFSFGIYFLYCICYLLTENIAIFSLSTFIRDLFSASITNSYWFIYAYLGFLLLLPFMQRIAINMTKQEFYLLLIAHFAFSSLVPIIDLLLTHFELDTFSITSNLSIALATQKCLFYPLIGYYIDAKIKIDSLTRKHIILTLFAALAGIAISCACTMYVGLTTGAFSESHTQLFDYVTAISVFIAVKYAVVVTKPTCLKEKTINRISLFSSLTFGIYLLEPYFIYVFSRLYNIIEPFLPMVIIPLLPTLFISFARCILSMILGGILTFILKKIFIFKKIL